MIVGKVLEFISYLKETKSATMNIFFIFFIFRFKSFALEVELSYVSTINLFTIAENCTEKRIIL